MSILDFLINHIKLKTRIYAGYVVTGIVALILAMIAYNSFSSLSADIKKMTKFNNYIAMNMSFVAKMAEMQHQAVIFIYEGHDWAGDQTVNIYQESLNQLMVSQELADSETNDIAAKAKKHLGKYIDTFKVVRQQRNIREQLVRENLRLHANIAQNLIEELLGESSEEDDISRLDLNRALNELLKIEKNVYRYFDSLDSSYIETGLANIRKTQGHINAMMSKGPKKNSELYTEIFDVLKKYERGFIEAVQRTRGFLYLVNVVMAAQAYETIYQSKKLSTLIEEDIKSIEQKISEEVITTRNFLLISVGSLLVFTVIFSFFISRSITYPLNRLTVAFQGLTEGSSSTDIPEYRLKDELGNLSHAAGSFKSKNLELDANKKELERSNDELEQFVYTVSHDLKSPLVTSMGFISIINRLMEQGKLEQAFEKFDKVVKANERMSQLIDDLLELSRVGRVDMDKKHIDLNNLLSVFAKNQDERLAEKDFTLEIQSGLPVIFANESRTLQLFENILSNAIKYVHNDAGPRLTIGGDEDEKNHLIFLKDNGPGIAKEYQEKIFGLFYRLEPDLKGTGVGLAVVKRIMAFHNGEIWVESEPGKGAAFWLKFPKYPERLKNE